MEFMPTAERFYSTLILALRITLPHLSVSSTMNFPKSERDIDFGTLPISDNRAMNGKASINFAVELVDDLGRRVLGRDYTIPYGCLVARNKLAHSRDVRQRL